jgi:hypothetical protein
MRKKTRAGQMREIGDRSAGLADTSGKDWAQKALWRAAALARRSRIIEWGLKFERKRTFPGQIFQAQNRF